jgi:hypothetical protein
MYVLLAVTLVCLVLTVLILVKLNKKSGEKYTGDPDPNSGCPSQYCCDSSSGDVYCSLAKLLNNYLFDETSAEGMMTYILGIKPEDVATLVKNLSSLPDNATVGSFTLKKGHDPDGFTFFACSYYLQPIRNSWTNPPVCSM